MNEIVVISVFFLAVTFGLHVLLFTKMKDKSERFWKSTDYLVIAATAFGLWGAAGEFQQQELSGRIHEDELSLEREYSAQQTWITVLANSHIYSAIFKMEATPNQSQFIRSEVLNELNLYSQFTDLQMAMANNRPYSKNRAALESKIASIGQNGGNAKIVVDEATRLIQRAVQEEAKLVQLRADLTSSRRHQRLEYLVPHLLAVALAIRATRVTAEVFILKKSLVLQEDADPGSKELIPTQPR